MKRFLRKIYNEIINTGERPIIEKMFEEMESILQCAYIYASGFVKGKTVLDIGCGGGYGTEYLSRFTDLEVKGFDIDKLTIYKNNQFFKNKNLEFVHEQSKLGTYNIVTSFQVIEHFKADDLHQYLSDISKKYLKTGGIFFCSTPNKLITSPELEKPIMVFHIKEFTPIEFQQLLEKYFKKVTVVGQCDVEETQLKVMPYSESTQSFRSKLLRALSQIEVVRIISRHLPMFIKYLLMGFPPNSSNVKYKIIDKKNDIDKCQTIIARCEN